ncbi:MAG: hypothetical protein ABJZ55_00435 [Fuerstiella sp.]
METDYYQHHSSVLSKQGHTTVFLCDPLAQPFMVLRDKAQKAFESIDKEGVNSSLKDRPEKASIDFDFVKGGEDLIVEIVQGSSLIQLVRSHLGQSVMYDVAFSKYRYVRHDFPEQMAYTPLHYDGNFLPGKSINVCIPFTGYGGPFPGLKTWPDTATHRVARKLLGESVYAKYLPRIVEPDEPYLTAGSALVFTEKVYHCRSVDRKWQSRLNLELRFFPESALSDETLDLRPIN